MELVKDNMYFPSDGDEDHSGSDISIDMEYEHESSDSDGDLALLEGFNEHSARGRIYSSPHCTKLVLR